MKKIVAALFVVVGLVSLALAQNPQSTENKADQSLRSAGRVNPSTLGMEFDLPLGSYAGRGINMPISISYSSKLWRLDFAGNKFSNEPGGCSTIYAAKFAENSASGWTSSLAIPYVEYVGIDNQFTPEGFPYEPASTCGSLSGPPVTVSRLMVHLPGGETHELRITSGSGWNGTFHAVDSSNLKYVEDSSTNTYRLMLSDGSSYDFATGNTVQMNGSTVRMGTRYSDRNGNYVSYNNTTGVWTDTLGREFSAPFGLSAPTTPTTSTTPITYTLPGMTSSYKFQWKYLKGSSPEESGLENYAQDLNYPGAVYGIPTSPWWAARTDHGHLFDGWVLSGTSVFNPVVLTEIEFPTGQKYEFRYDLYGRIVSVVYPTGGKEEFTYSQIAPLAHSASTNVTDQTNYGVTQRRVYETAGQGTPSTWNYSITETIDGALGGGYKVSITNPDGTISQRYLHRSDEACVGCEEGNLGYDDALAGMAYEERQFASDGTLVSRKLTHWTKQSTSINGSYHIDWHPRVDHEESYTYDSSGNGVYSTTKYEYEGDLDLATTPVLVKKTTEWGYQVTSGGGSISPSATPSASPTPVPTPTPPNAVRITENTYLINDPSYSSTVRDAYKARNIIGLVTLTKTKNGAGTSVVAQSEIKYDESVLLSDSTGGSVPGWSDPGSVRGLPTTTRAWHDIAANQYVETRTQYNQFGSVRKAWDGNGNMSQIEYADNYSDGIGRNTFALPTKTFSPIPGGNGSTTEFISTVKYDFNTGLARSSVDPNGVETRIEYIDPLLRPTRVAAYYNNQQVGAATETIYGAGTNSSTRFVKTRSQIDETKWKEGYVWFDGLGRTTRSQSVDSNGDVFVDTEYDSMSRPYKVTNPYRNGEPIYWTQSVFDTAGRPWKTITPDSAVVETTYSVATTGSNIGTTITVKDQSLKLRRSITNAFRHLTRVDEPNSAGQLGAVDNPNQPTNYTYDLLNNLTQVQQQGDTAEECGSIAAIPCSQTRSFQYDSLSRLKQATNPESGTILYTYDANSNLETKTDARQVVTTYGYDGLNRVKTRIYSAPAGLQNYQTTSNVTYYYDNLTNAKGKLIKVTNGSGDDSSTTEYTAFDILGRVTAHKQTTDNNEYTTGYTYNLAGALIEQQYPNGRVVKNVLDGDGELATVQSKKSVNHAFWNFANRFTYNAAGAMTSMQLGNGRWESMQFNERLQPTQIALGKTAAYLNGQGQPVYSSELLKLNYEYGELYPGTGDTDFTKNNGNISKQTITVQAVGTTPGFVATQYYAYDSLNRIEIATENVLPDGAADPEFGWRQHFKFDRYGNRNFVTTGDTATTTLGTCQTEVCNPSISPTTNKITSTGYLFDGAGNTTRDAEDRKFTYDAENKQTKVESLSAGTQTVTGTVGEYFYDGDGKRVKKKAYRNNVLTEETIFVYEAAGKLIGEYSNQVASSQHAEVAYLTNDPLGSPRINTGINGNVTARHDYHPFGEEVTTSRGSIALGYVGDTVTKQFTGYEHDGETELDFAQARFFSRVAGRFSSPDAFTSDTHVSNAQSWNLYSYVRNNPLFLVDPTGKQGTVSWYTGDDGVVHVRLSATFAVYGAKGQNVSKADLNSYKNALVNGIKELLTRSGEINGKKISMTTNISAKVYSSEEEAATSGRGNLVELGYDELKTVNLERSAGASFQVSGESFDRMAVKINPNDGSGSAPAGFWTEMAKNTFAHEFTHLLGALHNYNGNEAASLLSPDGGNGAFFESDFKQIVFAYNDTTFAPPPPFGQPDRRVRPAYSLQTMGASPRRATHIASTPSDVYQWVRDVSR